jgi:hypothetical protein
MGLLRAIADVVIVGAGTLRADPEHRWTAAYIAPSLARRRVPGASDRPGQVEGTAERDCDRKRDG